jgi:hypothetical protein
MRTTDQSLVGIDLVSEIKGSKRQAQMHDASGEGARKESADCFGCKPELVILSWAIRAKRLYGCSPV